MAKKIVKIADLAQLSRPVDISDDEMIMVRALNLREMVKLFMEATDDFLPLYAAGLDGNLSAETLGPFLLSAPSLVARIISLASDEPENAGFVETNMPATVQLIALHEIWKASIPDPKKAKELLSEVTALLLKLKNKGEQEQEAQKIRSQTTPVPPLKSLSPTDIVARISGDTA